MDESFISYARSTLPLEHVYADWAASALPLPLPPISPFIPPYHVSTEVIDEARTAVNTFLKDHHDQFAVIFTSGATASFEILAKRLPWSSKSSLLLHQHVHNSVAAIRYPAERAGAHCEVVNTEKLQQILTSTTSKTDLYHETIDDTLNPSFLFLAYPAECNLTGAIYPPTWGVSARTYGIGTYKSQNVIVLLDTAKSIASAPFDTAYFQSCDAFALSFYKLSATETGLGALLIRRNSLLATLIQTTASNAYFSGAFSSQAISPDGWRVPSTSLEKQIQIGTPNMQGLARLPHMLRIFNEDNFKQASSTAQEIGLQFLKLMNEQFGSLFVRHIDENALVHSNATVSFTIYRTNGDPVGYGEVMTILSVNKIFARAGRMCNAGACAAVLHLSEKDIMEHYNMGHICGDANDVINGQPTGVVRVSFGWGSKVQDATSIVDVLRSNLYLGDEVIPTRISMPISSFSIANLFLYPVKSCGGTAVSQAIIDSDGGLLGDRVFGIEQISNREILTAKRCPRIAGLYARYLQSGTVLVLYWKNSIRSDRSVEDVEEGSLEIDISKSPFGKKKGFEQLENLFRNSVGNGGYSQSLAKRHTVGNAETASWLSERLRTKCRLVYLDCNADISLTKRNLLITDERELTELSLASHVDFNILVTAIRPSILLKQATSGNISSPFTDIETYTQFQMKDKIIEQKRVCQRCAIVNIITKWNSKVDPGEPLRSIAMQSKQKRRGKLSFGVIGQLYIEDDQALDKSAFIIGEAVLALPKSNSMNSQLVNHICLR